MAARPTEPRTNVDDVAETSSALERARRSRRRPWGPLLLLLAVGVGLLGLGGWADLGRLRGSALAAGAAVVLAVLAMSANRIRARTRGL